MTKPKLTYFDIHAGRGEPVRLMFSIGGIEFEDHRISFDEFRQMKQEYPFTAVPVLEYAGKKMTQSNAMLRHFGPRCGLWPSDPIHAFRSDEVMGALEDVGHKFGQTMGLSGDALKEAREGLVANTFRPYLRTFNTILEEVDGPFLCGDELTVADLKLFVFARRFPAGIMDHVPTDLVATEAPRLAAHCDAVANHEGVKAYYARVKG